jgi:nucleoside-diphosphate-sugar epimerase
MSGRIAVVGATGHLGRAVVPRCIAEGLFVCMIARHPPSDVPAGAEFITCDATDTRALSRALDGCSTVVNLMAGRSAAIECIAKNLLTAIRLQRVARLVHVSSLAVFGTRAGVFHEASKPCPNLSHRYAISKVRAEKLLEPQLDTGRCVILRPGCIYGRGAPVWTDSIGRLLVRGYLGDLGAAGAGIAPLVHVFDVADAIVAAINAPAGIYHVLNSEAISWNEYFRRFAYALGICVLPKLSSTTWMIETWLRSPAILVHARLAGYRPDVITPAMRRLFASRARIISRHPLCPRIPAGNRLQAALADAAEAVRTHAAGERWHHVSTSAVYFT